MPTDHRLRLDDYQRFFPARPNRAKDDPQQPVWISESGPSGVPAQHEELVAQSQVLQHELPARLEGCPEISQDGNDYAKHGPPNMTDEAGGSTTSIDDEVFTTHTYQVNHSDRCYG
jgi:hypothetical protein